MTFLSFFIFLLNLGGGRFEFFLGSAPRIPNILYLIISIFSVSNYLLPNVLYLVSCLCVSILHDWDSYSAFSGIPFCMIGIGVRHK